MALLTNTSVFIQDSTNKRVSRWRIRPGYTIYQHAWCTYDPETWEAWPASSKDVGKKAALAIYALADRFGAFPIDTGEVDLLSNVEIQWHSSGKNGDAVYAADDETLTLQERGPLVGHIVESIHGSVLIARPG